MTPYERERIERLLDLFAHPGWAELMEDTQESFDEHDSVLAIKDGDALAFRKGQLTTMQHFLNLEAMTRHAIEEEDAAI